jgi:hypothetical protein
MATFRLLNAQWAAFCIRNPRRKIAEVPQSSKRPVMKSFLSQALLVTFVATATSFGQTEAKTKPVGYESITLNANQFNIIGLRLQGSTVASGALETIGTSSVTDNEGSFATILTSGKTYVLEITSGTLSGLTVEATWTSGNVLNTPDNLSSAGVLAGVSYNLRPALTLEEIFGTTSSVLQKGFNASNSDIVWIPNGSGNYDRYFLRSTDSTWRTSSGNAAPNVALVYTDGIMIEKRSNGATLVLSGEVKTGGSTAVVINGFNVISSVYPAGVTLQNFGLDDDVKKGLNASGADIVWVPNGSGNYNRYFLRSTDNTWRLSDGSAAPASVSLTPGIMIERKDVAKTFSFTPPASYSGL